MASNCDVDNDTNVVAHDVVVDEDGDDEYTDDDGGDVDDNDDCTDMYACGPRKRLEFKEFLYLIAKRYIIGFQETKTNSLDELHIPEILPFFKIGWAL